MKKKVCRYCTENKSVSEFTKNTRAPDGYNHFCRICLAGYRSWLRHNKEEKELKERFDKKPMVGNEFLVSFE